MLWWMGPVFFIVALGYSMAGFGGGSSYIALLLLAGFPVTAIPVLALLCNLIVSGQGSLILARRGQLALRPLMPLLAGSMPAALLAGAWRIQSETAMAILATGLVAAGLALLVTIPEREEKRRPLARPVLLILGAVLGALAGLSGIGGGIFLAPVLHLLRADNARQIAGTASLFIALNSLMGLTGHLTKGTRLFSEDFAVLYAVCPLAVLIGGQLGSRILSGRLRGDLIRRVTGLLVLLVAVRIWWGFLRA